MKENKNILKLAGKEYEVECNFRKQHDLTKFRNKLSYGIDFSEADKNIMEEIIKFKQDMQEEKNVDLSNLSQDAIKFLNKTANKMEVYTSDELIEIGMILTKTKSVEEMEEIYDKEIMITSYDDLVNKLMQSMSLVFTNAKSGSENLETKIIEMKANEVAELN